MSKAKKGSGKSSKADAKAKAKAPRKGKAKAKTKTKAKAKIDVKPKLPSRVEQLLAQFAEAKGPGDGPSYEDIEMRVQKVVGLIAQTSIGIRGGRHNERVVEGVDTNETTGRQVTRYRGESVIDNLQDIKDADALKQWCYRAVRKLGVQTRLGTVIPGSARNDLARALASSATNCRRFNAQEVTDDKGATRHRTCEIVFDWALYESVGDGKAATAALLDQIGSVFDRVDKAQHDADDAVLARAPNSVLPKGTTSAEVMKLPMQKRRPIIAKARAELARRALADIAGAELILPEEVSVDLAKTVDIVKSATKAWVAGASDGDKAYEQALAETDLSGLSQQQEYLVAAASKKRDEATNAAIEEAGLTDEAQLDLAPMFTRAAEEDDSTPDDNESVAV